MKPRHARQLFFNIQALMFLAASIGAHTINPDDPASWPCGYTPEAEAEAEAWLNGVAKGLLNIDENWSEDANPPNPSIKYNPDESMSISSVVKSPTAIGASPRTVPGPLTGKIIYLMAGHGWTHDADGDFWTTQRGVTNSMVEDMGNQDQAYYFAEYALNAGATVVPMRPIGFQTTEVIVDNDDASVVFAGTWLNSSSTIFYGTSGDVPYRYASTVVGAPTATATFNATIASSGFYPVYVWTRHGSDRINQEYIVGHSGGTTARRIQHRAVGSGWIYMGTFHFEAGGTAYVQVTNSKEVGETGTYTFADAVRFGNGMGSIVRGSGTSGKPREEENGRYWAEESCGQGHASSIWDGAGDDHSDSVSAPAKLAANMNREAFGAITDRIYLSFHSNAGGGRGADGLFCSDVATPTVPNSATTPNGYDLANALGTAVNLKLRAMTSHGSTPYEHIWGRTGLGTNVFGSGGALINSYGEINNVYHNSEMAATIIETAFHDQADDARLMRDPRIRNGIARANLQGVVNFFNDKAATPLAHLPEPPRNPRVITANDGTVTLSWDQPDNDYGGGGDNATGYVVYTSQNGYGFTYLAEVSGIGTTSLNITSALPDSNPRYFAISAFNAGGESFHCETVVARRTGPTAANILIVNSFDRLDRFMNTIITDSVGTYQRVRSRFSNSYDYTVPMGNSLALASPLGIDTCQDDHIIAGTVLLTNYRAVFYIFGEESTGNRTITATEQTLIASHIASGGCVFVSGAEVGYDIGRSGFSSVADIAFYNSTLNSTYVSDDAATYTVAAAGPFAGKFSNFNFDNGTLYYDSDYPDRLGTSGTGTAILTYVGGLGGNAGIAWSHPSGTARTINLGFPAETITTIPERDDFFAAVAEYFNIDTTSTPDWEILD